MVLNCGCGHTELLCFSEIRSNVADAVKIAVRVLKIFYT